MCHLIEMRLLYTDDVFQRPYLYTNLFCGANKKMQLVLKGGEKEFPHISPLSLSLSLSLLMMRFLLARLAIH